MANNTTRMMRIKIIIERAEESFWAYSENIQGINGVGNTANEVKQSVLDCIEIQKGLGNFKMAIANNYVVVFKFDTKSILEYYNKIFTNVVFERITGISPRQMSYYQIGLKKFTQVQVKKMELAFHKLGAELIAVELK